VFLGHFAVGLAARRVAPEAPLAAWFTAVQLADLVWPVMLLVGVEHVRVAPGITRVTPLDFYDYPITHSLVALTLWGAAFGVLWAARQRQLRRQVSTGVAIALAAGVMSHWILDVLVHRPDMPVLPHGPYVGLGIWNSIPLTLALEFGSFAIGIAVYLRGADRSARGPAFWSLMALLVVIYFGAVFGPPAPNDRAVAFSALALWLVVPWAWWIESGTGGERKARAMEGGRR
jgi:hypothetical protein